MKCTQTSDMSSYFQMKCSNSDIPPIWNCQQQHINYYLICLQWEPIWNSHRIRSAFQMKCSTRSTCQMKCSDIPPQCETGSDSRSTIPSSMSSMRAPFETVTELGQLFRWSVQLSQLVRWSAPWVRYTLPFEPVSDRRWSFSDELIYVFNESPFQTVMELGEVFQMKCPSRSTCQMKCTLRSGICPSIRYEYVEDHYTA